MLSHEIIRISEGIVAEETILFLHGMLGRRGNLRSFSKRFVNNKYQALLVDHRGHGSSTSQFPLPNTIASCSGDIDRLVNQLIQSEQIKKPPSTVVGHSFGGKVALEYRKNHLDFIKLAWILDSTPVKVNPNALDDVEQGDSVVRLLRELKNFPDWSTKGEMKDILTQKKFSPMVVNWMTTNVTTNEKTGKLGWVFDLKIVEDLYADYCAQEYLKSLSDYNPHSKVHFIRAEKNYAMWTPQVLNAFLFYVNQQTVQLHLMRDTGHFLHAENPQLAYDIMKDSFVNL